MVIFLVLYSRVLRYRALQPSSVRREGYSRTDYATSPRESWSDTEVLSAAGPVFFVYYMSKMPKEYH